MSQSLTDALARQRVLPVVRAASAGEAVEAALVVTDAGLTMVELTATTPDWAVAVGRVRDKRPHTMIGLGTVTDAATASAAIGAGASFLVSPWPSPEVREVVGAAGIPFLEGAFSPGEVAASARRGPVKVFPAHALGPAYIRSLRQLLPTAVLVPTGGIALDEVPSWLDAGAHAVGVGSDLWMGDLSSRLARVLDPLVVEQEPTA